jgi:hypothetical protein
LLTGGEIEGDRPMMSFWAKTKKSAWAFGTSFSIIYDHSPSFNIDKFKMFKNLKKKLKIIHLPQKTDPLQTNFTISDQLPTNFDEIQATLTTSDQLLTNFHQIRRNPTNFRLPPNFHQIRPTSDKL